MKQWKTPELKELSIRDTEYFSFSGSSEDGVYKSNDDVYEVKTYSGPKGDDRLFS